MSSCNKHTSFKVAESTIAGAGQGLFSLQVLARGQKVLHYTGSRRDRSDHSDHTYCFRIDETTCLCPAEPKAALESKTETKQSDTACLAKFVNDVRGSKFKTNLRWRLQNGRVLLETTRRIQKGEELFVDYGPEYWQDMEQRQRQQDA